MNEKTAASFRHSRSFLVEAQEKNYRWKSYSLIFAGYLKYFWISPSRGHVIARRAATKQSQPE